VCHSTSITRRINIPEVAGIVSVVVKLLTVLMLRYQK
jgi:hypothetical protein